MVWAKRPQGQGRGNRVLSMVRPKNGRTVGEGAQAAVSTHRQGAEARLEPLVQRQLNDPIEEAKRRGIAARRLLSGEIDDKNRR